jgi:hypothetical protein
MQIIIAEGQLSLDKIAGREGEDLGLSLTITDTASGIEVVTMLPGDAASKLGQSLIDGAIAEAPKLQVAPANLAKGFRRGAA